MYKLQLISHPREDVHQAKLYYNHIYPRLGKRFHKDFYNIIENVVGNPFVYGSRIKGFRTANLNIFPYQLYYIVEEATNTIIIIAVLHAHRHPNYIQERLNK